MGGGTDAGALKVNLAILNLAAEVIHSGLFMRLRLLIEIGYPLRGELEPAFVTIVIALLAPPRALREEDVAHVGALVNEGNEAY